MSISITRYVNITSGLGAGNPVATRDLIGRLFTNNPLLSPQTILQFSNAQDVGTYFGATSEEYYRALFYFSWINKSQQSPPAIQYARWVNVDSAPKIYSAINNKATIAAFQAIMTGSFGLTIGGVTNVFTGIDFSGDADLAAVAATLQAKIRTASGSMFTSSTVTYQTTGTYGNGGFIFTGGADVAFASGAISVQVAGGGIDITGLGLLGWLPEAFDSNNIYTSGGALWVNGSLTESITSTLTTSANVSNNFGSFLFLNNLALNLSQVEEAATWNNAQNVLYLYTIPVSAANVNTWSAGLQSTGGCALTLAYTTFTQVGTVASSSATVTGLLDTTVLKVGMPVTGTNIPASTTIASIVSSTSITLSANATGSATETITFFPFQFPEQLPMMIEAATNYDQVNSVQNYMFQVDNTNSLSATVIDDATANSMDSKNINYYGQTQEAGTQISFYQRGVLQGQTIATNVIDMTAYVNEIWLKDAALAAIMNLLLQLNQIPANQQGRGQILSILQGVINQAVLNGTISVGKKLTSAQIAYINNATSNTSAWYQVQNNGYWVDVQIVLVGLNYEAQYLLIYSKDDVIRKVTGTQTLI